MLKCTSIKYYGNKVNVMQIEFGNICPETRGKISHSFFFLVGFCCQGKVA